MLRSQKNKDQEVYVVESYISSISYFQKQGHNFNSNKGIDALVFDIYNLLRVTFGSVNAGGSWKRVVAVELGRTRIYSVGGKSRL